MFVEQAHIGYRRVREWTSALGYAEVILEQKQWAMGRCQKRGSLETCHPLRHQVACEYFQPLFLGYGVSIF